MFAVYVAYAPMNVLGYVPAWWPVIYRYTARGDGLGLWEKKYFFLSANDLTSRVMLLLGGPSNTQRKRNVFLIRQ
jgi:hypothetical protein